MNKIEAAGSEDTGVRGRRLSGGSKSGSKSVANEHPLLKVCHGMKSSRSSVLTMLVCGAHDIFSAVWSRGVQEKGEAYG